MRRKRLPDGRVLSFTATAVEGYHSVIRLAAAGVMDGRPPYDGALEMTVLAVFSVPASWSHKKRGQALAGTIPKVTKPDIENTVKGALDSMQGVAYLDDRQVTALHVQKCYGDRPRLEIKIELEVTA